jgi:hypothetical protein
LEIANYKRYCLYVCARLLPLEVLQFLVTFFTKGVGGGGGILLTGNLYATC